MKHSTVTSPPVFRCDCVKLKKATQAMIYEETKYMTPEERREYSRKASEECWSDIERRRKELAQRPQIVVSD